MKSFFSSNGDVYPSVMKNKRPAKRIIEKDENSFSKHNEEDELITMIAQIIVNHIMSEDDDDLSNDCDIEK
jgi:hypothetical protein